ncbi:MAG: hypothetical protein A2381_10925 [Bdellovibrionales bacterium RIFOXYB1_FULL_37_110]|nr:MAG: hypothetical protein A2181_07065 [Bdellovibrionales bacterium RIFOXYA1_FULL_38_20]OFZ51177.1 MAG: hypothetical protein A2417_17910 [Bdellovibrionales bacterium RIFOXYC1_FULL_37_79]OFZ61283.1 MAG: hypothetical protein A2381_10925 [Bdellovibrionales bacterium RIFOXYB1_FULL_37_110]OFZ62146.1 MAG: hypothetical protein A2577_14500 [Bdellovibrionales bacterium RIFOXYD1_FULL_36_51]OFZ65974.1 MAG: hypothetical protein A2328_09280 [Bdellovibrionales bacterium RIFOXYB2_FULL_36_6]
MLVNEITKFLVNTNMVKIDNNTIKETRILFLKSKFFIIRALIYFSFLLVPVWLQKTQSVHQSIQCLMMAFYTLFMIAQWFLLGKEIDYRLKIYFRVNSSIDRVVYRMFLGMFFMVVYFNLLSFLPSKWIYNLFWITWVVLGLFYSWPTRGKIIKESVSTNLGEYKYLDSFEKTLVGMTVILFIVSMPELPALKNIEALKLHFDPLEKFSTQLWNFLIVNYYPFRKYPDLFKLAWSMHFYFVSLGGFLLLFYATVRYFVSRRLSLLGVFALISSWSFSKILAINFGASLSTTYTILWVWTLFWVTKSSTYRAGLYLGLVGYWGTLINQSYAVLLLVQITMLYFFFLKDKTSWFKRQLLKYAILGIVLSLLTLFFQYDSWSAMSNMRIDFYEELISVFERKAFNVLSIFGLSLLVIKLFVPQLVFLGQVHVERDKVYQLFVSLLLIWIFSMIFDDYVIQSFSIMWPIVLLSLIPLELVFQAISRLRSRRNMIYLIYIIICLLDSHVEGRVKIFLRIFNF